MNRRLPWRLALGGALLVAALAARASADAPLGFDGARHLLARTGFGPSSAEVDAFVPLTRVQAVERLLAQARIAAQRPPPASIALEGPLQLPGPDATPDERRAFNRRNVREGLAIRAWWIEQMVTTPSPLTERMTLFWHNHFVSSQRKVRLARLMLAQNVTLREHALGSFATLLHAAAKDPAMMAYLDVPQNRRGQPNENFAREVMELFTLGEGRYAEADVREAARAFTGWSVDRATGRFAFRRPLHDPGEKTVLGRTGRFDGDAVLDLLLAHPATAEHVVAKLWREFVSPDVDAIEVRRIAATFRDCDYAIRVALRELLLADAFWAPANRGVLVKSPVELVVGALRQLEVAPADGLPFALVVPAMGQDLFAPPNVKGWPGGDAWINANTLLARKQFLERLARADAGGGGAMRRAAFATDGAGPEAIAEAIDDERERRARFVRAIDRGIRDLAFDADAFVRRQRGEDKARAVQALLLPLPPQAPPPDDAPAALLLRATLLDPAYQLK